MSPLEWCPHLETMVPVPPITGKRTTKLRNPMNNVPGYSVEPFEGTRISVSIPITIKQRQRWWKTAIGTGHPNLGAWIAAVCDDACSPPTPPPVKQNEEDWS